MATTLNAVTSAGGGLAVTGDSSGVLGFQSAGTTYMTMDASGNVGIGTSSPVQLLTVESTSNVRATIRNSTENTSYASSLDFATGSGSLASTNVVGRIVGLITQADPSALQSALTFHTNSGDNLAERMRIDSSGNVGIGTSSPSKKLDVNGSINANGIELGLNGEAIKKASGALYIETGSANPIIYGTNSSERMRIDSSGNVLVGTTSMATGFTARLNSSITGNTWAAQFENNATSYDTLILSNHATSGNNRFIGFGTEATWTERGYIYYDRAAGQTKLSATSDYRAKDIVGDTVGALDLVSSIKVKDAKLKWAEGQAYPMYIAHELQEVAPWAVSGEKDAVDEEGKPVYQTVSYESMVATLTAAIQEQQELIKQLQADVAALKGAK